MSLLWTIAWGIVLGFLILFVICLIIALLGWLFFGNSFMHRARTTFVRNIPAGTISFTPQSGNFANPAQSFN